MPDFAEETLDLPPQRQEIPAAAGNIDGPRGWRVLRIGRGLGYRPVHLHVSVMTR